MAEVDVAHEVSAVVVEGEPDLTPAVPVGQTDLHSGPGVGPTPGASWASGLAGGDATASLRKDRVVCYEWDLGLQWPQKDPGMGKP